MSWAAIARGPLASPWEATGETLGDVQARPSAHLLREACSLCLLLTWTEDTTSCSWEVSGGQLCTQASLRLACAPTHFPTSPAAGHRQRVQPQASTVQDAENLGATGQGGNHGPSDCSDACGELQPACTESQEPGPQLGDAVWPWCDQLAPRSLNSSPAPTPPPPTPHRVLPCWVLASGGVGGGERNSYLLLESHPGWLLPTVPDSAALARSGAVDRQG